MKCVHLYLESMIKLPQEQPQLYQEFMSGLHVVQRSDRYWAGLSTDLVIEQVLMRSLKTNGGLTRGRGMTEQQCLTWLLAMPTCAETNRAMQEFTGVLYDSREQNKDMTNSRMKRDMKDTLDVLTTISERSPFLLQDSALRNIMTGVHTDTSVNVDMAQDAGKKILKSMKGQTTKEYTFKCSSRSVTMASKSAIQIGNDQVQIDPQLLFQRLILVSSSEDLESLFQYELCSYPTALFNSSLMLRKPQKPVLADAMWSMLSEASKIEPSGVTKYVLDGAALLHRLSWPHGTMFKEVYEIYSGYVLQKYGRATTIVFDGYDVVSTKSMMQERRTAGKVGATVSFTDDMKIPMKKDIFLANKKNKQAFVIQLASFLQKQGFETLNADGDADVLIVKTAVESANTEDTILVGDDTELLILLAHYVRVDAHRLYMRPEPKSSSKKRRVWYIIEIKKDLREDVCRHLFFIHALLGCDTTSSIYGIGKGASLNKFVNSEHFRQQALVFDNLASTVDEVKTACENAIVCLYGGKPGQTLDQLRYQRYLEKLACKSKSIQPQSLPPTSSAVKYHSLRVYLQIREWKDSTEGINYAEWGWRSAAEQLTPIMTDLAPAPQSLLQIMRCNCSQDCSTHRCSCRKNDLPCNPACGQCKGSACTNAPEQIPDDEDSDSDSG